MLCHMGPVFPAQVPLLKHCWGRLQGSVLPDPRFIRGNRKKSGRKSMLSCRFIAFDDFLYQRISDHIIRTHGNDADVIQSFQYPDSLQ